MIAQAAFAKAEGLDFPLLSDPDGSAAAKFAVAMKGRPYAERVTFIIDPEGVLREIIRKVDVTEHGRQVLTVLESLKGR